MRGPLSVLFVIVIALTSSVGAIVVRHDRDGLVEADTARRFGAVVKVLPDGESVLVAPSWVLTAAHVAEGFPVGKIRVRVDGLEYPVDRTVALPGWKPGRGDIALMHLSRPVRGVRPLVLGYDVLIANGVRVTMAGRGDRGDGERGVMDNDGRFRVGSNAVSRVETDRFTVRHDHPDEGALDDEAISGPGDSGTPALVMTEDGWAVVGIGSVGGSPKGRPYGSYGSEDTFIRLTPHRAWIESVLDGD